MKVKIQIAGSAAVVYSTDDVAIAVRLNAREREELQKAPGPGFKVLCAAPVSHPLLRDQTQVALFAYDGWGDDSDPIHNIFHGMKPR